MSTLSINGTDLMNFANALDSGHLKMWKANGMTGTLHQIPNICKDRDRLTRYVQNCLQMEGFNDVDIEQVTNWLIGHLTVDS